MTKVRKRHHWLYLNPLSHDGTLVMVKAPDYYIKWSVLRVKLQHPIAGAVSNDT